MAYRWNERSGRYADNRGRFVSERAVRGVVDAVADGASERMAQASQRLLNGEQSLASWQSEVMREIRLSQLAAHTIARGGAAQMRPASFLAAARDIKEQYRFLRDFAAQVADGRQPMNGSLVSRARQYGQASRSAFEREYSRGQQQRGYQYERNVLAPAEHCAQCREETAKGWAPIGSLVPVGRRTCRGNCRCRLTYSRSLEQAA